MGKGNRNKLGRAQAQIDSPEAYLAERRKLNKKKKNKTGLGVTVTCIVLVAVIVLSIALGALSSIGVFARMTNTLSTENFVVTEAMMQFFYNDYILNWMNSYYYYIIYGIYNVDFTTDLREQEYSSGTTWYDYFMTSTVNNVTMYLEYAEGAKAANLSLTDEEYAEIDETVELMKQTLKEGGETIADRYGDHVSANDIRKCYEIIHLASKFNDYKMAALEEAIRADGDKINLYPESHKEDFYTATYASYTITVRSDDEKLVDDAALEAAKEAARSNAEIIAAAKDPEAFLAEIKAYIESVEKAEAEETTDDETSTDEEESFTLPDVTEEETTEEIKLEDYTGEIEYSTEGELEKWIFVENANENDAKIIEESTTETSTDSTGASVKVDVYNYTVYMLLSEPALDTELTMNIGYVITTDKTIAEEIREAFLAGEKTAAALEELGLDKYNELPSDTTIELGAGSSKNAEANSFEGTYAEFDEWLNAGRNAGDLSEVITIAPTEDGASTYYIVGYFEDWSDPVWVAQAIDAMVGEGMDEWYMGADGNGGQLAATPVKTKERSLKGIDVSAYLVNFSYSLMYSTSAS